MKDAEQTTEENSNKLISDSSVALSYRPVPSNYSSPAISVAGFVLDSRGRSHQQTTISREIDALADSVNDDTSITEETSMPTTTDPSKKSHNNRVQTTSSVTISRTIGIQETFTEQETTLTTETALIVSSTNDLVESSRWVVPTDNPIISGFNRQEQYGKGTAIVRFGSSEGDNIFAVESGVVVFVGDVAGETYITVKHSDGLRSTYSVIGNVVAVEGDEVSAGQKIAEASGELGLTARDSEGHYLDPELFF